MDLTRILLPIAFSLYLLAFVLYLLHFKGRQATVAKGAFGCIGVAFALQTFVLGQRWLSAGYLPVTHLFSTLFFFCWSLAAVYLYFELRYRIRAIGLFVIFLNLFLLGAALPRDPVLKPLVASLDTPLFSLHIVFSFFGYAFFAMAFSLGVLYLLQRIVDTPALPDLLTLRRLNEEAIFLGFILFTLCMIFGAIWAYVAWGYYISWNIKSVWSLVVWLFYAGMCHAKFIRRWQGSGYAALSIAGFGVVLFTYLGIGLLLSSNHPLD
jgi:cytochrome c-type biogenesis protein CcsB